MEIVRERDHGRLRPRHDAARIFPLLRLSMQIRHRAGVAVREPAVQVGRVSVAIEPGDAGRREAEFGAASLDGDHKTIVSRSQRAKFTTSSTAGIARSSPYAVNMRHCM